MTGWIYAGFVEWLAEQVQGMLAGLVTFLTGSFFLSPDVTVFPQVRQLADRSVLVVNAAYVLVIITAGAIGMTHGSLQIRYAVKDLLPRLVVGFVAANFGAPICRALTETTNALTTSLAGQSAPGPDAVRFVQARMLAAAGDPAVALLAAVIGVLIVVLFYLLLVGWITRVALLIVLAGIAPVALACHGLPQTEAAAALWWRALLGCLVTPTLQAVFFTTGIGLLQGPVNLAGLLELGPAPVMEIFNLLVAACLLALTVRIPGLVARHVSRSRPGTPGAVMIRAVLVSTVTRRLRLGR
ncbi:hypothetical protein [Actinoplanes sp. DH11]|uniref:hypothetical protein n=1 Tax=Actinoplanes sp. DH11 TaxID=2857011 RepID=UPI001E450684|nr:hypothetical protein [Actinoplanes sp. DH11]